jgi:hypothetical protein
LFPSTDDTDYLLTEMNKLKATYESGEESAFIKKSIDQKTEEIERLAKIKNFEASFNN